MTPEQKAAAKQELFKKIQRLNENFLSLLSHFIEATPEQRGHMGCRPGGEMAWLERALKAHNKESNTLMRPFDRGDFD